MDIKSALVTFYIKVDYTDELDLAEHLVELKDAVNGCAELRQHDVQRDIEFPHRFE